LGAGLRKAIAVLRDEINTALKVAMKAQDERRVSTPALVNAAFPDRRHRGGDSKKSALSDDDLLGLLQKMIKQRQESVDIYDKAGRKELADQERGEIAIIQAYCRSRCRRREGRRYSESSRRPAPRAIKDMARVMAALIAGYAARWIRQASGLVKSLLRGEAMSSQDDAHARPLVLLWLNERNAICRPQPTPA